MTDVPAWARDDASEVPEWARGQGESATPPEGGMAWSDVPGKALENLGPSALQFGKDIVQPFLHPIDTAESLKNIGHGLLQKTNILHGDEYKKYPEAVGQFFADRYGGVENLKKTLAEDPVGFASDLSLVLTGGAALPAKVPGVVGQTGRAVQAVGRAVDPLTAVGVAAKGIGHTGAAVIGELGTHTGKESLLTSAKAGFEGGEAARALSENRMGLAPMEEAVESARTGLDAMRNARGSVYNAEIAPIFRDTTILDFSKIDNAVANVESKHTFKGQWKKPEARPTFEKMSEAIENWKNLDPAIYHTIEGLDALKQQLGSLREGTQPGTPARSMANEIYHSVRSTIVDQDKRYAKVMRGYELASDQIKEIERALSVGEKASIDTGLRKLQSILRNNVSSSYGHRRQLAEFLINNGAPHLMERLAGQATSSWAPRGLGKLAAIVGAEMVALTLGFGHGVPTAMAAGAATLPFTSPKLMGATADYGGRAARVAGKFVDRGVGHRAFQTGRIAGLESREEGHEEGREAVRRILNSLPTGAP